MTTTQDIHAAADAVASAGKKPTLAAVRAELGGGSFSTISAAMKEWRKTEPDTVGHPRKDAPPAVLELAATLATQVWGAAADAAEERLRFERTELEVKRIEMEAQRDEAIETADTLAAELDTTRAVLEAVHAELEEERKDVAVLRAKLENEERRASAAEQKAEEARAAEIHAREEAAELRGRQRD